MRRAFGNDADEHSGPGRVNLAGTRLALFYDAKRLPEFMPDAPEKGNRKPSRITTSPASQRESLTLTPLQMLGVLLKVVLKDRITDDEIDQICSSYHTAIIKWFPWPP